MLGHRCGKPAKVQEGGVWLCHLHTEEGKQKRSDAWDAKYKADLAMRAERYAKEEQDRRKAKAFDGVLALLAESQESIGGDWRKRRDLIVAEWAAVPAPPKPKKEE
jgi:hypothetical protein